MTPFTAKRKGNSLVEFALVSVFIVPLMMGTVNVGLSLSRSIQTAQISRDAGHMFVRQVDFSLLGNRQMIVRLTSGMGMTLNGGNGVVILTRVLFIGANECAAAGLAVDQCPNFNQPVITQRFVVGNAAKRESSLGTPSPSVLQANGTVTMLDYLTAPSVRAAQIGNLLNMAPGELAYVSEAFFESPEWSFPETVFEGTGVYARTIF